MNNRKTYVSDSSGKTSQR